nr:transporter substrate-binding domain-containing protein [Marinobacter salicampi]
MLLVHGGRRRSWLPDIPGRHHLLCPSLCALILLAGHSPVSAEPSSATEPLRITYLVLDDKAQPFQIVQDNVSTRGIVSDIVSAVFAGSRYQVEPIVLPVNRLRDKVQSGRVVDWVAYDAPVWNSFGDYGEMAAQPLFVTNHVLLTCNPALPARVEQVEDLKGLAIVSLRHFRYPGFSEAMESGDIRSVPVERFDAGLKLVSAQSADGFLELHSRLNYHVEKFSGDKQCFREVDVSSIIPQFPIYLSYDRNMPAEVKELINSRLLEMGGSGELEAIRRRYIAEEAGLY